MLRCFFEMRNTRAVWLGLWYTRIILFAKRFSWPTARKCDGSPVSASGDLTGFPAGKTVKWDGNTTGRGAQGHGNYIKKKKNQPRIFNLILSINDFNRTWPTESFSVCNGRRGHGTDVDCSHLPFEIFRKSILFFKYFQHVHVKYMKFVKEL